MQITFYCHLYMNENLKKKEAKIKKKLSALHLRYCFFSESSESTGFFFFPALKAAHLREHPFICGRTG